MHIKISLTVLAVICGISANACDICGCSAGSNMGGWSSFWNVNSVGVMFSQQRFQSTHPTLFENKTPEVSRDDFQTADVHFRLFPMNNLLISGQVPVRRSAQYEIDQSTSTMGIGDPSLSAHLVLSSSTDSAKLFKHRLLIGGGVKFPFGNNTLADDDENLINANLQPGTGSFDFPLSASYLMKADKWGAMADLSYVINTANENFYQYGNRFASSIKIMRWIVLNSNSSLWLRPHAGLTFQNADWDLADSRVHRVNPYSKGHFLYSDVGASLRLKDFILAGSYQLPIEQQFAQGNIEALHVFQIEINYLIKTKKQ